MVTNRKTVLVFLLLILNLTAFAQILDPIKWNSAVKQTGDNSFELQMTATMEDSWHVYSTTQGEDSGGVGMPTEFTWTENKDVKFTGGIEERGKLLNVYSELINAREKYFADKVTFVQKVTASKATRVSVEVMYQVCNDEGCLPPDYKTFEFALNPKLPTVSSNESQGLVAAPEASQNLVDSESSTPEVVDSSSGINLPNPVLGIDSTVSDTSSITSDTNDSTKEVDVRNPGEKRKGNFWEIFIFGMLGGFAALLMPCIFPMIPLTVSMFTKQSKSRGKGITKAIIYGVSIIVIYVLLGLVITAIFGPSALNALATNPWVNIAFFILFIIFAISFFGAFEITLPSSWVNKADQGADKGGMIGIFFMALTLVLVSFSCTGPIIGTLLVESASSGALLGPAIGMFGFALALALPFTLFAIFPGWLNSLPSSGGWLNTVKVSLGFVELAFALKFLSNADLVWQLHWLEREIFLSIWIAIFFVMGLYLLNIFKVSHDSDTKQIGWPRLIFAILTFVGVFYMLPGLWGAPLKIFSGLTPPKNYSESPTGFFGNALSANSTAELPENAHYGPHQIPAFYDIEDAFAYSKKVNKPVMIDFTGDACANCRKVEDNVWADPRVQEKLRNEVVLASLYVDRMVKLPQEEQVYSEEKGRNLRTIGDKWSAYQIKYFKSNSQPLYIIVDENLKHMNEPMGTELNIEKYLEWMDAGIENFAKK
ncbi:MAG: cytochrome c biogenesis protein CcdA [Flavobacteriaceae bacterium]|nr:cytochrome c biogenesis protein CcdA [Flavobacteriaceae bacterium]